MLINHNSPIILASSSNIRKKILESVGLRFEAMSPFYNEDEEKKSLTINSPAKLAVYLASQKALSVSQKYRNTYVIGADQVCEVNGLILNKSSNKSEAIDQLKKLNNQIHTQNNGLVIAYNNKIIFKKFSKVSLKMRKLTIQDIEKYVDCDQSFGCAGSYKYEAMGQHLFAETKGDYYAILGLSVQPLLNFFHSNKIISF